MHGPLVYLKGEPLDTDGQPLKIERANNLFEGEPIKGEYSYPFTWPLTERSRKLLGNIQENSLLDEPLIYEVKYMSLGELVDGLLYIDKVTWNKNTREGSIDGNLNGTEGILANSFGTKKLSALRLGGPIVLPAATANNGASPIDGDPGSGWTYKSAACEFATGVTNGTIVGYDVTFPMTRWLDYRDRAKYESFHHDTYNTPDSEYWDKDSAIPLPNECVNYWTDNLGGIVQNGFGGGWDYPYAAQCYPYLLYQHKFSNTINAKYNAVNRIIPMFTLKGLLTRIFADVGFDLKGAILSDASFSKLIVVNNYSVNKWVFRGSPDITIEDTCTEINPANHVPDMAAVDFLNQVFSWLGLVPKVTNATVTLYTVNEILAMTDYPVTCPTSPEEVKSLTDNYSSGMNMKYTFPTAPEAADGSAAFRSANPYLIEFDDLIKSLPATGTYIEVNTFSSLPAPSPYNIDLIALVRDEQQFYQNSKGVWTSYGMNLVNHTEEGGKDRTINGSTIPIATWVAYESEVLGGTVTPNSIQVRTPVIRAKGSYFTDTYDNFTYHVDALAQALDDDGKQKFNSFPLMMLFYHGLHALTISAPLTRVPYASPFQIDPNGGFLGPWDLTLEGSRSLFHHFFDEWNKTIKGIVKYTVELYPSMNDTGTTDLHTPKALLNNRMLPYKITYTEPYDGTVTMECYKVKDTNPKIVTELVLSALQLLDIQGFPIIDMTGSTASHGSGSYILVVANNDAGTSYLVNISETTDGQLSTLLRTVKASEIGCNLSIYLMDPTNRVNSNVVSIQMPAVGSGSFHLALAPAAGSLDFTGTTVSGCSGEYRLEIRNTSDVVVNLWHFYATGSGSITYAPSYATLGLTAGQTYHFTVIDTPALTVSNSVAVTV
ncbi:MAG: hypothetical protein JSS76_08435 [Bacteroidetes bacterium]|nr:hypothetical protein [Bacteroidota bacterium]